MGGQPAAVLPTKSRCSGWDVVARSCPTLPPTAAPLCVSSVSSAFRVGYGVWLKPYGLWYGLWLRVYGSRSMRWDVVVRSCPTPPPTAVPLPSIVCMSEVSRARIILTTQEIVCLSVSNTREYVSNTHSVCLNGTLLPVVVPPPRRQLLPCRPWCV